MPGTRTVSITGQDTLQLGRGLLGSGPGGILGGVLGGILGGSVGAAVAGFYGGSVINDLADGDNSDLAFPNELMAVKTGKNGNTIFALNTTGRMADLKLRLIRGSYDDKMLNDWLAEQNNDPASFRLIEGQLVKRVGDGQGNITSDTYILSGGVFVRFPAGKSNAEGDTDQSVAVYEIRFANGSRSIL